MTPIPISASNAAAMGRVRIRVSRTSRRQFGATASVPAGRPACVISLDMGPAFRFAPWSSALAGDDEVGHPAQRVGLGAEDLEMAVGLVAQQPCLRPRPFEAQD